MNYFFLSMIIIGVAILGMSLGVIFQKKPLKGSCGGLNKVMGDDCDFCDEEKKKECHSRYKDKK
ncbi:MAG: (Na+)-NQR maturation NqrM [Oligoflexales bacterium]